MSLSEPATSRRDLAGSLTLSCIWIFVTVVGLLLTPDAHGHGTHQRLGLPPCPSVLLLDRPCPGCGLTTSWTALLHGNLGLAFHAHALGPFLYAGYTAFALATFWFAVRQRRWRDGRWVTTTMATVFVVFLGYGLGRMALTPHYAMAHERLIRSALGRG
jgi:hypothetical protein